jgi:CHAT domain-containing protein
VAALYGNAQLLVGAQAGVADVLAALNRSRVAHIAAHGSFRSDNPLFSSLRLADGPLTVYDLQGLDRAPHLVVLAACDGGSSSVAVGDELLGLATGFLGVGTKVLVAPMGPVSDEDVAGLMVELHRRLRSGLSVAEALAAVRLAAEDARPQTVAAALSLTCFGAGHSVREMRAPAHGADASVSCVTTAPDGGAAAYQPEA